MQTDVPKKAGKSDDSALPVIILGTGADARIAAETVTLNGQVVYGFLLTGKKGEGAHPAEINDIPILGHWEDAPYQRMLKAEKMDYFLAEHDARIRKTLHAQLFALTEKLPINIIHPSAVVSASADLAQGNLIQAGCVLCANVRVEANNILAPGCILEADAVVGSYNNLGAGVKLGAGAIVQDFVFASAGAMVGPHVTVEQGAVVGAGSVVLKNVRAGDVVFGVPAQVMKEGY